MKIALSQRNDSVKDIVSRASRVRSEASREEVFNALMKELAYIKDIKAYAEGMEDLLKSTIEDLAEMLDKLSPAIGDKKTTMSNGIEIQSTWVKIRSSLDRDKIIKFVRKVNSLTKIQAEAFVQQEMSTINTPSSGKPILEGPDGINYWRRTSFIRK
ncbi:MAG: hypothetical protein P1Q69_10555 [Candidatus Thorarchaeota archaeon]|nr:hypothetical protein [Candidatus Thorarchaeota archaeon]